MCHPEGRTRTGAGSSGDGGPGRHAQAFAADLGRGLRMLLVVLAPAVALMAVWPGLPVRQLRRPDPEGRGSPLRSARLLADTGAPGSHDAAR